MQIFKKMSIIFRDILFIPHVLSTFMGEPYIDHNQNRPHQSLKNLTPNEFIEKLKQAY